mgnify:CR=1 FL=1
MKKWMSFIHYISLLFILFTTLSDPLFSSCPCGATTCTCYNSSGQLVGSVAENCNYAGCPWMEVDCRVYDSTAAGDCNAQIPACNNNCSASCGSCQSTPPNCNHQCFLNCLTSNCNNCGQSMGGCEPCEFACSQGCGGGCLSTQKREDDLSLKIERDKLEKARREY